MSDIKKGAGKVKRSYAEVGSALKERKAARTSKKAQKKGYEKLIDTTARKGMGKTTSLSAEQKQELYMKGRKTAKKKYKHLK